MNFLKKIILVLLFLFPISNSFGAMVTEVQNDDVENSTTTADFLTGIHFNKDGTKMFTLYQCNSEDSDNCYVNEYNLSTPFDISTKSYAGDGERCELDHGLDSQNRLADLEFSSDGMKLFTVHGDHVGDDADDDGQEVTSGDKQGCSCATASGSMQWSWLLALLLWGQRRRPNE